jgi:hypothetical protein
MPVVAVDTAPVDLTCDRCHLRSHSPLRQLELTEPFGQFVALETLEGGRQRGEPDLVVVTRT